MFFLYYSLGMFVTAGAMGYLLRGKPYAQYWPSITWAMVVWPVALPIALSWLVLEDVRRKR